MRILINSAFSFAICLFIIGCKSPVRDNFASIVLKPNDINMTDSYTFALEQSWMQAKLQLSKFERGPKIITRSMYDVKIIVNADNFHVIYKPIKAIALRNSEYLDNIPRGVRFTVGLGLPYGNETEVMYIIDKRGNVDTAKLCWY